MGAVNVQHPQKAPIQCAAAVVVCVSAYTNTHSHKHTCAQHRAQLFLARRGSRDEKRGRNGDERRENRSATDLEEYLGYLERCYMKRRCDQERSVSTM